MTGIAWEAQRRLHHRYKQLMGPGRKKAPVVSAVLGRKLSGFVGSHLPSEKPR